MPRKGETATPQKLVDKFIKRHLEGAESVDALAKEYRSKGYNVSRATGYMWVTKFRLRMIDEKMLAGGPPEKVEKAAKTELIALVAELKAENTKLRNKVIALMMKSGEL
jgi:transposase